MAKASIPLTQERLKELLSYDPETGEFTWLVNRAYVIKAGDRAGVTTRTGYRLIGVDGKFYMAHRLAFLFMLGEWPEQQVDHMNRVRDDNRWANLRDASRSQNMANYIRARKDDTPRGVVARGKRFTAVVQKDRQRKYLGTFDTAEEAHAVYLKEARRIHGEYFPD